MSRTHLAIALAATLAWYPIAAHAQNPAPAQPSATQQAPPADSMPLAVRPGDVVRVTVWGHPELSGEFPIDENYNLLFPLIGPINVRPLSVVQLRERLNTDLSQLFQRPFIAVTPLFRVAVLGEVLKPGLYSADPTLTVFDMLALAGGPTRDANQKKLQLLRGGENIGVSVDAAVIARSTLRELGVRSGDQIVVPRAGFTRDDWGLLIQIASLALLTYTVVRR